MSSAAVKLETGESFDDYVRSPEVHATGLKNLLVSPLLYKRRQEVPMSDSDTLRVGRAAHTAILEHDRFLLDYALWTGKVRRGKEWEAFVAAQGKRTILTAAQYKQALRMRDAVQAHPVASKLLSDRAARREVSLRWTHPRTGIKCKARIDWLGSALIDIKSTRNPDPRKFAADAARLGYVFQLAFYDDGRAANKLPPAPVKIVSVQNVEPYDVVVFDLDERTLAIGREQVEAAFDLLVRCQAANDWPGLASEEVTLRLPAWAAPDYDEDGPDESQPIEDVEF
jgi:hypothetical protein